MRSFALPAARFIRIRSSIEATRTVIPSISNGVARSASSSNPCHTRRGAEDVEVTSPGPEREVIARRQGLRVEEERDVLIDAAEPRAEVLERLGEPFEVLG